MPKETRGRVIKVNQGTLDIRAGAHMHNCRIASSLNVSDVRAGDIVAIYWDFDVPYAFCVLSEVQDSESTVASTSTDVSTDDDDSDSGVVDTNTWKQYATMVVAASDSSTAGQASADYICTGTNDDATINSALAGGARRVLLLEGTYILSGKLNLATDTYLQGQGIGATVLHWFGYTDVAPVCFECAGDNVTISDLDIDHYHQGDPGSTVACSTFRIGGKNLTVRNVRDLDNEDGNLLWGTVVEGPLLLDNVVGDSPISGNLASYSLYIEQDDSEFDPEDEDLPVLLGTDIKVVNCTFDAPMKLVGGEATEAYSVDVVQLIGITVTGSQLECNGMVLQQLVDVVLSGNRFTATSVAAQISNVISLTIQGNTLEGDGDVLRLVELWDLDMLGTYNTENRSIAITGNTFRGDGDHIILEGPDYPVGYWPGDMGDQHVDTLIVGNQFWVNTQGSSRSIFVNGAADIIIHDNGFNNIKTPIDLDGKRVSVQGNHFRGCGYSVYVSGSCRDLACLNNTIFDSQYEAVIVVGGLVGGTIKGNYFLHGSQLDGSDPWIHTVTGAVCSDLTIEGNKFRKGRAANEATYCLVLNASETVWDDSFTDSNDTNIADHTPTTGTAYTVLAGVTEIQGNAAEAISLPYGNTFVVADRGVMPTEFTIKWWAASDFSIIKICFRVGGTRDFYYVHIQPIFNILRLRKEVDTVMTQMATSSQTLVKETWYTIKITQDASGNINVYHNGAGSPCITVQDSTHLQYTAAGFFSHFPGDRFDDMELKAGDYGTIVKDNDFRNGAAAELSVGANVDVVYFGENLLTDGTIYDQEATRREAMAFLGV